MILDTISYNANLWYLPTPDLFAKGCLLLSFSDISIAILRF